MAAIERKTSSDLPAKHITVTYKDEYSLWAMLEKPFRERLPIRDVEWFNSDGHQMVNIEMIPVELRPFSSIDAQPPRQSASLSAGVQPGPLLHLYFIIGDDLDEYKRVMKKRIKDWQSLVMDRRFQEWLIVYVDVGNKSKNKFNLNIFSVFEKIKSDFNVGKKERCVQLRHLDYDSSDSWDSLMNKIKEGILTSFTALATQYDDDIRKMDQQRLLPGWNYCQFFSLKESYADCYEMMHLFDLALRKYDELDALFEATVNTDPSAEGRGSNRWMDKFGAKDVGDETADILNLQRKPFSEYIRQNTITTFDFYCYLFAKQSTLLLALKQITAAARRTLAFVQFLSKQLMARAESLRPDFTEIWIYSVATRMVQRCDEVLAASTAAMDTPTAIARGELLYLARRQLNKLGVKHNLLPTVFPFVSFKPMPPLAQFLKDTFNTSSNIQHQQVDVHPITTDNDEDLFDISQALESIPRFDVIFLRITERALTAFRECSRRHIMSSLTADLVALQMHRGKYGDALGALERDLPTMIAEGWEELALLMKDQIAVCHYNLQRWPGLLSICFEALRAKDPLSLSMNDRRVAYANAAQMAAAQLKETTVFAPHSLLSATFLSELERKDDIIYLQCSTTAEGYLVLPIALKSAFPMGWKADSISLIFSGLNLPSHFVANDVMLEPNSETELILTYTGVDDIYEHVITTINVHFNKLTMSIPVVNDVQGAQANNDSSTRHLQKLYMIKRSTESSDTLSIRLEEPIPLAVSDDVAAVRTLRLSVLTGRETFKSGLLRVSSSSGLTMANGRDCEMIIKSDSDLAHISRSLSNLDASAILTPLQDSVKVKVADETVSLCGCPAGRRMDVLLPVKVPTTIAAQEVQISLEYITKDNTRRHFSTSAQLLFSTPLDIKTQIHHSDGSVIIHVTIQGRDEKTVQLLDATLVPWEKEGSQKLDTSSQDRLVDSMFTINRPQNAPFPKVLNSDVTYGLIFKIQSADPKRIWHDLPNKWTLHTKYCFLPTSQADSPSPDIARAIDTVITLPSYFQKMFAVVELSVARSTKSNENIDVRVGQIVELQARIFINLNNTKKNTSITLLSTIEHEDADWFVIGQKNRHLHVRDGEDVVLSITAVPLRSGYRAFPSIGLYELNQSEVGEKLATTTISGLARVLVLARLHTITSLPIANTS